MHPFVFIVSINRCRRRRRRNETTSDKTARTLGRGPRIWCCGCCACCGCCYGALHHAHRAYVTAQTLRGTPSSHIYPHVRCARARGLGENPANVRSINGTQARMAHSKKSSRACVRCVVIAINNMLRNMCNCIVFSGEYNKRCMHGHACTRKTRTTFICTCMHECYKTSGDVQKATRRVPQTDLTHLILDGRDGGRGADCVLGPKKQIVCTVNQDTNERALLQA